MSRWESMPKFMTQQEAYTKCKKDGCFIPLEQVDVEKVKSTVDIAEADLKSCKILTENISEDNGIIWNSIYKLNYDALHELVEAFLRFDRIKSDNHQCLFAYLCEKHPELELSWDFFEKIRTKRNGIHYYGEPVQRNDWVESELQFSLYITLLKREIKRLLSSSKTF